MLTPYIGDTANKLTPCTGVAADDLTHYTGVAADELTPYTGVAADWRELTPCTAVAADELTHYIGRTADELTPYIEGTADELTPCTGVAADELTPYIWGTANKLTPCTGVAADELTPCIWGTANKLTPCTGVAADELTPYIGSTANTPCTEAHYIYILYASCRKFYDRRHELVDFLHNDGLSHIWIRICLRWGNLFPSLSPVLISFCHFHLVYVICWILIFILSSTEGATCAAGTTYYILLKHWSSSRVVGGVRCVIFSFLCLSTICLLFVFIRCYLFATTSMSFYIDLQFFDHVFFFVSSFNHLFYVNVCVVKGKVYPRTSHI